MRLKIGYLLVLAVTITAVVLTQGQWRSLLVHSTQPIDQPAHNEGHVSALATKALALSDSAKASLGLELSPIVLQDYWRSIPIPAEVMEEPGHCEQGVSSSVHGIVLKILAFHGQTVRAGDPLFEVKPTSELLATSQTSLLKTVQEIELVQTELKRLATAVESGGLAATRRIEKEYELKRLESNRLLQMQELLIRGLSDDQITEILRTKTLIRQLTIRVPPSKSAVESPAKGDDRPEDAESPQNQDSPVPETETKDALHEHGSVYSIEQLNVHLGKLIQPGEELCRLARHSQLLIAGRAFERESLLVTRAIEQNWPVKAVFEATDKTTVVRPGLVILYTDNVVEPDSRTIRFYLPLPNELVRDRPSANGLAYRSWRFKPGQRAQVLLPVEHLPNQIVIPAESVVKEGAEAFVFRLNGKRIERVPVRLQYMDSRDAVIKNDGTLAAGDIVARNQAYQLDLALRNSQGSHSNAHEGHDHAGHSHEH